MLNFSFPANHDGDWPLAEWPLDELELQNKNEDIACYE